MLNEKSVIKDAPSLSVTELAKKHCTDRWEIYKILRKYRVANVKGKPGPSLGFKDWRYFEFVRNVYASTSLVQLCREHGFTYEILRLFCKRYKIKVKKYKGTIRFVGINKKNYIPVKHPELISYPQYSPLMQL